VTDRPRTPNRGAVLRLVLTCRAAVMRGWPPCSFPPIACHIGGPTHPGVSAPRRAFGRDVESGAGWCCGLQVLYLAEELYGLPVPFE
jgi:hypothetical protein